MSTCISRHGEFSSHTLDDSYTCTLCHVLDEDALRAELASVEQDRDRLQAELTATRNNRLISAIFGHHPGAPKPFALYRRQDETGVSGTGVVALGAEFPDGMVVLRWTSAFPTSVVFHERGIESVEAVHGHGGKTQVVWLSDELEPLAQAEQRIEQLEAQRDEVLELCNDAAQVIGVRGFLAVDAIRAAFAEPGGNAPVESAPAAEEPRSPHRCPDCSEPTVYQSFSGGREWYCKPCDDHGMYEQGEAPPRAQMLADGRFDELRQDMRAEIVRRKTAEAN